MFSLVFAFLYLPPTPTPAGGEAAPTPTFTREMGSTSSQKLTGLFKGLLFGPVTHILDSTGNGDTWAVTIWIQLLSAQRNWKGLHNGQTHPTSEAWLPWPRLEKSLWRPPLHPAPHAYLPQTAGRKAFPPFKLGWSAPLKFHSGRTVGGSSRPGEGVGGEGGVQVSCGEPKSDFN